MRKGSHIPKPEVNGRDCELRIKNETGVHEASCIMITSIAILTHDGTYLKQKAGKMAVFGK